MLENYLSAPICHYVLLNICSYYLEHISSNILAYDDILLGNKMTTSLPKFSFETTGKSIRELSSVASSLPAQTPVNIAFLGNESHEQRVNAAATIKALGLEPTPIISSRRLKSKAELDHLLSKLKERAQISRLMLVGGDPISPEGPYENSLALFESDFLQDCHVDTVVIAGYPEGHPNIPSHQLFESLKWKITYLREHQYKIEITTQLAFCTESIINWVLQIRSMGIDEPIRIGVPCPTKVKALRHFANLFGVNISPDSLNKYEMNTPHQELDAKTDVLYLELLQKVESLDIKNIYFHLYTLDGLSKNKLWIESHY